MNKLAVDTQVWYRPGGRYKKKRFRARVGGRPAAGGYALIVTDRRYRPGPGYCPFEPYISSLGGRLLVAVSSEIDVVDPVEMLAELAEVA